MYGCYEKKEEVTGMAAEYISKYVKVRAAPTLAMLYVIAFPTRALQWWSF